MTTVLCDLCLFRLIVKVTGSCKFEKNTPCNISALQPSYCSPSSSPKKGYKAKPLCGAFNKTLEHDLVKL